ncbi:MAG: Protease HtpX [candidate division WS2 bacterium]|nr:Protease HtpX [Candidatus Psychracetigena formicireducens]
MHPQRAALAKENTRQTVLLKSGFYLILITYLTLFIRLNLVDRIREFSLFKEPDWWSVGLFTLLMLLPLLPLKLLFDWSLLYYIPKKFGLIKYNLFHFLKKSAQSMLIIYLLLTLYSYLYYYSIPLKLPGFIPVAFSVLITPSVIAILIFGLTLLCSPLVPKFLKLSPLEESTSKRFNKLLNKHHLKPSHLATFKDSDKTNSMSAFFTGFGPFKKIVFSENLLKKAAQEELEVVGVHEIGHYRYGHFLKGLTLFSALIFFYTYIGISLLKRFGQALNSGALPDLANFPLLFLFLLIINLVGWPLYLSIKREWEYNVDRFAIKAINNSRSFISIMEKFMESNLKDPNPHYLIRILFFTHPPIIDRINLAKKFRK